jgi:hypothetical protein
MKKQIILIHGGSTYATYEDYLSALKNGKIDFERYKSQQKHWKQTLNQKLGEPYELV